MNKLKAARTLENLIDLPPKKIGLFDSGIGGLSILNELTRLPIENFIYVADTAHLPYGSKTVEFLIERAIKLTQYLEQEHGITTIVIACHTSAATTLDHLEKKFPHITFIDPLPLTTSYALERTKTNHIGVFATERSIDAGMHKKLLLGQNSDLKNIKVHEQACPLFVNLIENNGTQVEIEAAVNLYAHNLQNLNIDSLILGCTHYPFIAQALQKALPDVYLISAASCIAELINTVKQKQDIYKKNTIDFKISGDMEKAKFLLEKYLQKESVSSFTIAQLETLYI